MKYAMLILLAALLLACNTNERIIPEAKSAAHPCGSKWIDATGVDHCDHAVDSNTVRTDTSYVVTDGDTSQTVIRVIGTVWHCGDCQRFFLLRPEQQYQIAR